MIVSKKKEHRYILEDDSLQGSKIQFGRVWNAVGKPRWHLRYM